MLRTRKLVRTLSDADGLVGQFGPKRQSIRTVSVQLPDADEVLTIEDVMAIARLSKTTALHWVRGELPGTPQLPAVRIGRQWRVRRSDLARALDSAAML